MRWKRCRAAVTHVAGEKGVRRDETNASFIALAQPVVAAATILFSRTPKARILSPKFISAQRHVL